MIDAEDAAFQQTPIAFDGVCVNLTVNVASRAVPDSTMIIVTSKSIVCAELIRANGRAGRHALADDAL